MKFTAKKLQQVQDDEMIEVYWGWYDKDANQIVVAAKDYYDNTEVGIPDGENGENGIVYDYNKHEPYNYYREINLAFWKIRCHEASESVYNLYNADIEDVISKMDLLGFMLEYNSDLDIE